MPSINTFRCDRCIKDHKKCSKLLPICLECNIKGLECTYLKGSKYTRWNTEFEGNIIKYSLKENKTKGRNLRSVENKVSKRISSNKTTVAKFSIFKLPPGFDRGLTPLGIINKIPRFQLLDNLMTLVQYPSPYKPSNGLSLFLKLVEKLNLLCIRKRLVDKELVLQRPKLLPLSRLLEQSVKNYFLYSNISFPLFIEENFDFYSKPWELRFAIMATGLSYMKKDEFTEYLLSYFSNKLKVKLINFQNTNPNLESIQTLLLLAVRLFAFPWVAVRRDCIMDFCDRISTMLGLYKVNINISSEINLERALVFSSLTFIMTSKGLISGGILKWPIKPKSINYSYRELLADPLYVRKSGSNKINHLILAAFYCDASSLFYTLSILKRSFLNSESSKTELKKLRISLLQKIILLKLNYINNCNQLLPSIDHQNYISFICHYLRYYCYSLSFYHPSYNTNPDNIYSNNKDVNLINSALKECYEVIKYASILPINFIDVMGIGFISQCSIFALRYKHLSKEDFKSTGKEGIKHLSKDHKIPSMNLLCNYNLYLVNIVKDNVN